MNVSVKQNNVRVNVDACSSDDLNKAADFFEALSKALANKSAQGQFARTCANYIIQYMFLSGATTIESQDNVVNIDDFPVVVSSNMASVMDNSRRKSDRFGANAWHSDFEYLEYGVGVGATYPMELIGYEQGAMGHDVWKYLDWNSPNGEEKYAETQTGLAFLYNAVQRFVYTKHGHDDIMKAFKFIFLDHLGV